MKNKYIIITPAKNEEVHIEKTINSVLLQTILPEKWVIISDGSTDRTNTIVRKYSEKNRNIEFINLRKTDKRNFASKVCAIKIGYDRLKNLSFDFIGILDADISIERNYYKKIIEKFTKNLKLGIAGGHIYEPMGKGFKSRKSNTKVSVAGSIQVFRRLCYEKIGGFVPIKIGGEDWYLEILARMNNWEVESFSNIIALHHKPDVEKNKRLKRSFIEGKKDYLFGSHPLFEIIKCIRRIKEEPKLINAYCRGIGYLCATIERERRVVPSNVAKYLRKEQVKRIKRILEL